MAPIEALGDIVVLNHAQSNGQRPTFEGPRQQSGHQRGMEATIDGVGRLVVPKALRDALGLVPGSRVDLSLYGPGLALIPSSRSARLTSVDGQVVADSETVIVDEVVLGLIDAGRR